jgi:hypothetical protein
MLLMAIAGGLAYNYGNYVSEMVANQGTFAYVLADTIRAFKNDFRLIKPKKFGFDGKNQKDLIEVELQEIGSGRESVRCEIKVKTPISDVMVNDYL